MSYSFETNSVASDDVDFTNTGLPEVESTPTHLPVNAYSDKTPVRCEVRNIEPLLDPVRELRRVYEIAKQQYLPFIDGMPTRENPLGALGEDVTEMLLRSPADRPGGSLSPPLD